MAEVSVIVPTFNRAHLLSRAVNSVLRQSYEDFELVVVDDGSTDDTQKLMRLYDDDRLRYVEKADNEGASAARNVGIEHATGEYYVFLDSDDELLPKAIETLLETLRAGDHVCVTSSDFVVDADGTVRNRTYPERTVTLEDLVKPSSRYEFGGTSGGIVDAAAIAEVGRFDEALDLLEDHDLYLRLAKRYPLYCTREAVSITYKTDEDRLTTQTSIYAHRDSVSRFLRKHEETLSATFAGTEYYRLGHFCAREGDRTEAARNFKKALSYQPTEPKYLLYFVATEWSERLYSRVRRGEDRYKNSDRLLERIHRNS